MGVVSNDEIPKDVPVKGVHRSVEERDALIKDRNYYDVIYYEVGDENSTGLKLIGKPSRFSDPSPLFAVSSPEVSYVLRKSTTQTVEKNGIVSLSIFGSLTEIIDEVGPRPVEKQYSDADRTSFFSALIHGTGFKMKEEPKVEKVQHLAIEYLATDYRKLITEEKYPVFFVSRDYWNLEVGFRFNFNKEDDNGAVLKNHQYYVYNIVGRIIRVPTEQELASKMFTEMMGINRGTMIPMMTKQSPLFGGFFSYIINLLVKLQV